jgi:hypothetical protein
MPSPGIDEEPLAEADPSEEAGIAPPSASAPSPVLVDVDELPWVDVLAEDVRRPPEKSGRPDEAD